MAIRTIEIVCIPCAKCDRMRKMVTDIIRMMEIQYKTKMIYDFKLTPNLMDVSKYGLNPSQAPILIVNGQVEASGQVEQKILKNRLEAIRKS